LILCFQLSRAAQVLARCRAHGALERDLHVDAVRIIRERFAVVGHRRVPVPFHRGLVPLLDRAGAPGSHDQHQTRDDHPDR
jgi:hypothetical protein